MAEKVIAIHSVEEFEAQVRTGKEKSKMIVVDFTASWCPPCRMVAPIFAELAEQNPQAIFLKVDVDEVQPIAERFKVEAMPTFVFVKDGEDVHPGRVVGAVKEDLRKKVGMLCGPVPPTSIA